MTSKIKLVYCLRTCKSDMTSHGGFVWPRSGPVEAPDWNPAKECGGGLHGLRWGLGNGSLLSWNSQAAWVVFAADAATVVDLGTKVKVPRAWVVYAGQRRQAIRLLKKKRPDLGTTLVGATVTTSRDYSPAISGCNGIATAKGNYGTAICSGPKGSSYAGGHGIAVCQQTHLGAGSAQAGTRGIAVTGLSGIANTGQYGAAIVSNNGKARAGHHGVAITLYGGYAEVADYGFAFAGENGRARAGKGGTARAGKNGRASAGIGGRIEIEDIDGRIIVGGIGENGLFPYAWYRVRSGGFVECED